MAEETRKILNEMSEIKAQITDIQCTLENETNRNIQMIAEGRPDLHRKLDEALKVESEKEMLLIRVNRLEIDLRRIKERIENIA